MTKRHSWGHPSRPSEKLTIRICTACKMRKVGHHDIDERGQPYHWTEFTTPDGKQISNSATPPCQGYPIISAPISATLV